jgi:hypothetical protein
VKFVHEYTSMLDAYDDSPFPIYSFIHRSQFHKTSATAFSTNFLLRLPNLVSTSSPNYTFHFHLTASITIYRVKHAVSIIPRSPCPPSNDPRSPNVSEYRAMPPTTCTRAPPGQFLISPVHLTNF